MARDCQANDARSLLLPSLVSDVVAALSRAIRGGVHGHARTLKVRAVRLDFVEVERGSSAAGG